MATEKFFHVPEKFREFKGEKLMKWDTENHKVTLIVISGPKISKNQVGNRRHDNVGVQLISPLTLFTNYIKGDFIEPIPAEVYEKKFKQVVNFLK